VELPRLVKEKIMMLESSPAMKRSIQDALKKMEDAFSGKTPRKTPEEAKADREAWKQKSMADVKARNEKARAEGRAKDKANLPDLQKRHAELSSIYEKGKNWQYADRDQNMTPDERRAREVSGEMQRLGARINAAKSDDSYAKGGKINLKNCKVSTHEKSSMNKKCW
jgi:hypothetical protein